MGFVMLVRAFARLKKKVKSVSNGKGGQKTIHKIWEAFPMWEGCAEGLPTKIGRGCIERATHSPLASPWVLLAHFVKRLRVFFLKRERERER